MGNAHCYLLLLFISCFTATTSSTINSTGTAGIFCNESKNQIFSPCGDCSYLTCELIRLAFAHPPCEPCGIAVSPKPGCRCKDGYAWNHGTCVAVDQCSIPCNKTNERAAACGYEEERCQPSCSTPNRAAAQHEPEGCPKRCDVPICICEEGYLRDDVTGECIKSEDCPVEIPAKQNGTVFNSIVLNDAIVGTSEAGPTSALENDTVTDSPDSASNASDSGAQVLSSDGAAGNDSLGSPGSADPSTNSDESSTLHTTIGVDDDQRSNQSALLEEMMTPPDFPIESGNLTVDTSTSATPGNGVSDSSSTESSPVTPSSTPLSNLVQNDQPNGTVGQDTTSSAAITDQSVSPSVSTTSSSESAVSATSESASSTSNSISSSSNAAGESTTPQSNSVVDEKPSPPFRDPNAQGQAAPAGIVFYWRKEG